MKLLVVSIDAAGSAVAIDVDCITVVYDASSDVRELFDERMVKDLKKNGALVVDHGNLNRIYEVDSIPLTKLTLVYEITDDDGKLILAVKDLFVVESFTSILDQISRLSTLQHYSQKRANKEPKLEPSEN